MRVASAENIGWAAGAPATVLLGGWFAYLLIAPTWGFSWIDSWHNEQRAIEACLLAGTALLGVCVVRFRAALVPRSTTTYLLCGVALLGAVSSINARFVAAAFAEVSLYVLLVVLAAVTAASVRQEPARFSVWIRRACVLLALVHVAGIAARYAAMIALERAPNLEVLLLGYANPRFPTAFYALFMPLVATFTLDSQEGVAPRRVAWILLALLWCVNIALGTRAIWFAFALALPLMLLAVGWRRVLPGARVLGSTALAGLLIYYLAFVGVPAWLRLGSALPSHVKHLTSVSDRAYLWSQSFDLIVSNPWLGVGPMHFAALGDSFASHPHNWVLQVGVEWGLPALAILLCVLWRLGSELRRNLRSVRGNDGDVLAPLAAISIGLCYGLVDGNLVMPVSQATFALMLGVLLGCALGASPAGISPHRSPVPFVAAPVLASAAFLLFYVLSALPSLGENEKLWRQNSNFPDLAPRFWQQGLLR